MNSSNFISPLETAQVISIFNYVNILSDFLFAENYLREQDQQKHIPIVNSLYHYLYDDNNKVDNSLATTKMYLAQKLINNTDLYGAKENETLDVNFINTLLNHIISSLVFEKFTNVYGFIAETIRSSDNDSITSLLWLLKEYLINAKFDNESENDSELDPNAVDKIFQDIIEPLFPRPKTHSTSVTSIDYIYAQAGKMFLRSGGTLEGVKTWNETKEEGEDQIQEYIETAHAVEQLVTVKQLNESVLKIFALPALINYIYNDGDYLQSKRIVDIVNSQSHWIKAFETLFAKLNNAFSEIEKAQAEDQRYQFFLALSSMKNRTSLAREIIENDCPPLTEQKIEQEVDQYKNNPENYRCRNGVILDDLNRRFNYLMDNITRKYYNYEKESCREAFGEGFINGMDESRVVVTKGLVHYYYDGSIGLDTIGNQLIKPSDDLFQFYFPENKTYKYYALIRADFTVKLIKESEDPNRFREKLGLNIYESFRYDFFPINMKSDQEKFEQFLDKIAEERTKNFRQNLQATLYDQTSKEWWKDFGLSLIPFYSCVNSLREKNKVEASISCPLDVLFFIPVAGELGSLAMKMTSAATRSLLALSETTLRTVTIRTSFRTILKISDRALVEKMVEFNGLFKFRTFKNLGIALLRFIDPGFELVFDLGRGGLGLIKNLITRIKGKYFVSLEGMLGKADMTIDSFGNKIGKKFGKDAYVMSLVGKNSGYGYKYIPMKNGELAELRTVYPSREEVPLRRIFNQEEQIYRKVDVETEELIGKDYFEDEEGFVVDEDFVSEELSFEMKIENNEWDGMVEGKNLLIPIKQIIKNRKILIKEAMDFALKKGRVRESEIRRELAKYVFPETGKTEVNFVHEWLNSRDLKIPSWAEQFRVKEPFVFYDLKYKKLMESPVLTMEEAVNKIDSLYSLNMYGEIREELQVEKVLSDFKEREVFKYCTFEDYYALRYYGGSGYKKMAENSEVAKRMKNAIYRLAIRQSENPGEEYAKTLFRGEARLTEAIEKEFYPGRKEFEIQRFSSTSTDFKIADTYSETKNSMLTKVIYEIKFENPCVRSRVDHLFVLEEKETILLPGTKFRIDNVKRDTRTTSFGNQNLMKIELTHIDIPKSVRQQEVMKEIQKLMESDTVFYADDKF